MSAASSTVSFPFSAPPHANPSHPCGHFVTTRGKQHQDRITQTLLTDLVNSIGKRHLDQKGNTPIYMKDSSGRYWDGTLKEFISSGRLGENPTFRKAIESDENKETLLIWYLRKAGKVNDKEFCKDCYKRETDLIARIEKRVSVFINVKKDEALQLRQHKREVLAEIEQSRSLGESRLNEVLTLAQREMLTSLREIFLETFAKQSPAIFALLQEEANAHLSHQLDNNLAKFNLQLLKQNPRILADVVHGWLRTSASSEKAVYQDRFLQVGRLSGKQFQPRNLDKELLKMQMYALEDQLKKFLKNSLPALKSQIVRTNDSLSKCSTDESAEEAESLETSLDSLEATREEKRQSILSTELFSFVRTFAKKIFRMIIPVSPSSVETPPSKEELLNDASKIYLRDALLKRDWETTNELRIQAKDLIENFKLEDSSDELKEAIEEIRRDFTEEMQSSSQTQTWGFLSAPPPDFNSRPPESLLPASVLVAINE